MTALALVVFTPAAATAATTLCDRDLSIGDSGSCVERLQRRLNEVGLDCGNQLAVDGSFGPKTQKAVMAFKGRNRLPFDGVAGDGARAKLADPDEGLDVVCDATIRQRIRDIWPDSVQEKAIRVANCESGLNPIAIGINTNGTKDVGVFQFNTGGTLQEYLAGDGREQVDNALHSEENIKAALRLWRARGWQPWTCRNA